MKRNSYLVNTSDYGLRATCVGHSSFITHIDFTADSANLRSTCGAHELLFWDCASGDQVTNGSSALRDTEWATQTVPRGWSVEGVWYRGSDGTDINGVDANHARQLLAAVDDLGRVLVYNYPTGKGATGNPLRGHSSHVTNVRWDALDKTLLTTGGNDRAIMQWRHV